MTSSEPPPDIESGAPPRRHFPFLHNKNQQQKSNQITPEPAHATSGDQSILKDLAQELKNETNKGTKAAKGVWTNFKKFLNRGNVVDMAVGIVMGTAFTSVVNSLVNDIFLPFISLGTPTQLSNQFVLLRCPRHNGVTLPCNKTMYITPTDAKNAGAVTWNWGNFIQVIINFLIIAVAVFFIVKTYARAFRRADPPKPPSTKPCPLCTKDIPLKAKRCPECCGDIPEPPKEEETQDENLPTIQMEEKGK
ncbi:large conductance mechanosensitive channel protein [Spizellomyces punctatus DAOM BR117]|uniref:Large conductance mechanosensitive channel protein n=1 Tax=Spizellomyces punctatus (strain DAOM BR117) TaxID=645134 RepID=A0A0L0HV85_SPIPD|nr:large conductance mechanosensitive channel protein [Spizellomyces punctatus DAOM BR117]KND05018.1 large conductance mechanosensitive channel protein [Spizellomyces punctatus DAOM BR117]|eukprot:XP_016613057.1 large conductance mechanosensitive channel protein [Spizellomyces punctatus DAOM BR117]